MNSEALEKLQEIEPLMAAYHEAVWNAAEKGGVDYDMAGVDIAKKIVAIIVAAQEAIQALTQGDEEMRKLISQWKDGTPSTAESWEAGYDCGKADCAIELEAALQKKLR